MSISSSAEPVIRGAPHAFCNSHTFIPKLPLCGKSVGMGKLHVLVGKHIIIHTYTREH